MVYCGQNLKHNTCIVTQYMYCVTSPQCVPSLKVGLSPLCSWGTLSSHPTHDESLKGEEYLFVLLFLKSPLFIAPPRLLLHFSLFLILSPPRVSCLPSFPSRSTLSLPLSHSLSLSFSRLAFPKYEWENKKFVEHISILLFLLSWWFLSWVSVTSGLLIFQGPSFKILFPSFKI